MAIRATGGKLHWNYLLALERDLELISRYVEFSTPNFSTYSIELAHLLFAAASEVDVVAKLVIGYAAPGARCDNINDYKAALLPVLTDLPVIPVYVPRYGLTLSPWDNWSGADNPDWWGSYNRVKHQRDAHFSEATLKNTLNAIGALLILCHHYYSWALAPTPRGRLDPRETNRSLVPQTTLVRLADENYDQHVDV